MLVPLHKQLEGRVLQAIIEMDGSTFWSTQDPVAQSASIKITLETSDQKDSQTITLLCHKYDKLLEPDVNAWYEAVFGRQIYELLRSLDEREKVATRIVFTVTITGKSDPTHFTTNL